MPAFDPVRDAVLNSPVTPTQPLTSPYARREFHSSSPASDVRHIISSPTFPRRATDLSVLLNDDSHEPAIRTSPTSRPSTLSHILLPNDVPDDKLAQTVPFRRPSVDSLQEASLQTHDSPLPRSPSPISILPEDPTPRKSTPPPTLPYKPIRRITPATNVLVPMTQGEANLYEGDRCRFGARILLKQKRARSAEPEEEPPSKKRNTSGADVVATHYNERPEVGIVQRFESPIIGLKNFNNWVKSVLITRFAHPVLAKGATSAPYPATSTRATKATAGKVLEIGIGKGGDLNKWAKARIRELVGADIATISVEQARSRWESLRGHRFEATFAAIDCYTELLSSVVPPARLAQPFDVVSMQFCMHYAFESLQKTRCMLTNVTRWLRPGGIFIGTIPNADFLLERLDSFPPEAEEFSFGNSIYTVRFEDRDHRPIFGHKYMFYLRDAVDNVPEYVVRWDSFVQLASEFELYPIYKEEFHQVFQEHRDHPEFGPLMVKMKVVNADGESAMDVDQWEAANVYLAFAFEKR